MLLSASMNPRSIHSTQRAQRIHGGREDIGTVDTPSRPLRYLCVFCVSCFSRARDRFLDDLAIGAEPVSVGYELAALDSEDLDPAAALVVLRRDLERRHQPAERKVLDLLEPLLDILPGRRFAAGQLQR